MKRSGGQGCCNVAKYRVKHAKPPSQTWKTFLANHANQIAAVDFFTAGLMKRQHSGLMKRQHSGLMKRQHSG
jgi:hypothetical protein